MKTLAIMMGLFSVLVASAASAGKELPENTSASAHAEEAPIELQAGSIPACCNKTSSGGLTGCVPPPATGGCPNNMVSASCTGRDVSGLPTNCTEN